MPRHPSPAMTGCVVPVTIPITRGLYKSAKTFANVPLADVGAFLRRGECYERTRPTEDAPALTTNRVYVDLDGAAAPELTRDAFAGLVAALHAALAAAMGTEAFSLMTACKWRARKRGTTLHVLSFRLTLTRRHGTLAAVRAFVLAALAPRIAAAVGAHVPFRVDTQGSGGPPVGGARLVLDTSVYARGRKMRMLGQSKAYLQDGRWEDERRPLALVVGTLLDTLLTYIPASSVALPEPLSMWDAGTRAASAHVLLGDSLGDGLGDSLGDGVGGGLGDGLGGCRCRSCPHAVMQHLGCGVAARHSHDDDGARVCRPASPWIDCADAPTQASAWERQPWDAPVRWRGDTTPLAHSVARYARACPCGCCPAAPPCACRVHAPLDDAPWCCMARPVEPLHLAPPSCNRGGARGP